jgi:hypothetical protein
LKKTTKLDVLYKVKEAIFDFLGFPAVFSGKLGNAKRPGPKRINSSREVAPGNAVVARA